MVAVMITLAGLAVPAILTGLDDVRTAAAARYVASMARLARMQAVTRSAAVGIHFEKDEDSYRFAMYIDGNFNGIRTADIARGIDRLIKAPQRIEDQFPGVRFGIVDDVSGGAARPRHESYRESRRLHFLGGWGLWDVQVGFPRRCASVPSGWSRSTRGGPRLRVGGAAVGGAEARLHGGDAAEVGAAGAA